MDTTAIMDTAATASATSATTSAQSSSADLSSISGTDFMNILVKQLQMQDPFKPMSNEEMVSQLSTIRELEMNTRMSGKLEQLTDQQRFGSAAALIGRQVSGKVTDDSGNEYTMEGVVTAVRFTDQGDVMLELDSGSTLPLTGLETVTNSDGTTVAVGSASDTGTTSGTTDTTNATAASTTAKAGILQRLLNLK